MIYILAFLKGVIIFVFLASILGKLRSIDSFYDAIQDFDIVPINLLPIVAWSVLFLEAAILLLMFTPYHVFGMSLAIIVISIFSLVIYFALKHRLHVACNCFGLSQKAVNIIDILRNLILIVLATTGLLIEFTFAATDISLSETLFLLIISAIITTLILNLDEIIRFYRRPKTVK